MLTTRRITALTMTWKLVIAYSFEVSGNSIISIELAFRSISIQFVWNSKSLLLLISFLRGWWCRPPLPLLTVSLLLIPLLLSQLARLPPLCCLGCWVGTSSTSRLESGVGIEFWSSDTTKPPSALSSDGWFPAIYSSLHLGFVVLWVGDFATGSRSGGHDYRRLQCCLQWHLQRMVVHVFNTSCSLLPDKSSTDAAFFDWIVSEPLLSLANVRGIGAIVLWWCTTCTRAFVSRPPLLLLSQPINSLQHLLAINRWFVWFGSAYSFR